MSYSYFRSKIDALGAITNGKLVEISQSTTGSAELTAVFQAVLGSSSVALKAHSYNDQTDSFRLTGYVDLLEVDNWEFDLHVRNVNDDFTFVMSLLIPGGWSWTDSFPEIPLSNDADEADEASQPITLMDSFGLSTSWLILSNYSGYDNDLETELVVGINFKGDVNLTRGALSRLADLAGIETFSHLTGPVDEYRAGQNVMDFLGIRLSAPVPMAMDFGGLTVTSAEMLLRSPLRAGDTDLHMSKWGNPGIYLRIKLEVDGRPLEIVADYDPIYTERMRFVGYFTDFSINSLSTLDSSAGGAGLEASAPTEVGPPSGLSLSEFGFDVNLDGKKLESLFIGVRMGNTWDIVPGWFNLSQMGLRFTVDNPFKSSERSISVTASGVATVAGVGLQMSVTYPSLDFMARKEPSDVLSMGALMAYFIGGGVSLPAMNVESLALVGNARDKVVSVTGMATGLLSVPVGKTTFELKSLAFYLDAGKDGTKKGSLRGTLSFGEATADLAAVVSTETVFSGNFSNISLRQLYMDITGEASAPDEFPEVVLDRLNVTYNYTKDTFDLLGSATIAYDKLPFDSAITTTVDVKISKRGGSGQPFSYDILLTLNGTGPVTFAEGFGLNSFTLSLTYNTTAGWSVAGNFNTEMAGKTIGLAATYTSAPTGKKLLLSASASDSPKILYFANLFHLSWSRIDLTVEKTVVEGKPDQKAWGLRLDSKLSIPNVSTFDTSAEFATDSNGKRSLKFKPKSIKTYNLAIADGIGLAYKPKELSLTRDNANSNWSLVGVADLGITGVTGKLGKALPTSFVATVSLSKTATKVEMLNPMTPFNFPLPKADGQDLGQFVLEVRKIGVSLKPSVGFTAQLGLGFPKELNTYFKRQVFREYEAGNPMSMALLDCTVGSTGINLQFTTSPFLSGNANKAQNGEDWINFDFGDCGEIAMKMPSFKYNMANSYFEASGGFKIVRDLSLPLTPLRNFLDGVGMGAAKAIFPEKLPIKGLSLVDDNDNFKTEDLISMLGDIPSDVKTALRGAGNLLNRFPDGFKSYLKFEIPTQLEFKFGFSPLGRVSFALSAPVEPIRFLYPGMVQGLVPMPGLIGIELRKLNIGTLASGSLFFGDIDAVIDMYDLPSLVTSLALPTDPGFPLPTSDQLQRRIILKNVFSIIPLSQGVPVPVPVFHDEIGFEYMGLEGIGIQAHMGIPQPDFAKGGTDLLKTLVTFFKDRSYKLDPNTAPGGQQIKFRFRDEYLQAPEYLGGGRVGTSDTVIEIGTWKYVAQLMNFCKRFAMEHLIASIPLENRMANRSTKLAFFEVDGQYLITTPEEFDNGAYTALGLNADQRQDFHDVLPGVQTNPNGAGNGSSGLVMFLRGAVKAGSIFEMQACYGLAISGTMGFNTGFKFEGKVGGFIEAEIKGALLLNAKDAQYSPSYPAATPVAKPTSALPASASRGERKHLVLNGTNTYLEIPYNSLHDLKQYTVEMWVNLKAPTTDWVGLIGRESGNYGLMIGKRGEIYAYGHSPSTVREFTVDTTSTQFKFDQWQHIAYTYDGAFFYIYINGKFASSYSPWDGNQQVLDATPIIVGRDYYGSRPAYQSGCISELRIWKRARTEAELTKSLFERIQGAEPSLVSYYPLDADNGSLVPDFCSGINGKVLNGSYGKMDLRMNQGVYFDGTVDSITIPVSGSQLSSNYTLQFRFRFAQTANLKTTTYQLFDMPNSNTPLQIGGSSWLSTAGEKGDKYITIAVVSSGTKRRVFVDGALVRQDTVTTVSWRNRITLGGASGTNVVPLRGYLMDFQIWKGAKSDSWVFGMDDNPTMSFDDSTLLGMYMFPTVKDGMVQSVRKDSSATLTLSGIAAYQPAFSPSGLRFNSNAQVATIPISSKFEYSTYTVEMWFKPEVIDGEVRFLTRFISGNPRIATVSGAVEHRWLDEAGTYYSISAKSALIPKGQWSHIAATHDGSTGKLYINGVFAASKPSAKPLLRKPTEIIIGRNSMTDTAGNLNGSLDELRVWTKVRTESEIRADMYKQLVGNESGLVAYYPMDALAGEQLQDRGQNAIHGITVGLNPVVSAPVDATRYAVQAYGHSHLRIGGHEIMSADMRLKDDEFWFKGKLNLFPDGWGVRVYGDAEAYISKDKLYLYASTDISLCGLKLAKSRALITHERARLEGEWLGVYTLIDVQWAGSNPHFKGELSADWSGALQFGAIYIKGVRVCDNYKLDFRVGFKIAMDFDRTGFAATIGATFKIAGVGFSASFSVKVAPTDLMSLVNQLRDIIAKNAEKYLSHIFSDALKYAEAAWNGTLEFVSDSYALIGRTLSVGFNQTVEQISNIVNDLGADCNQLVSVLTFGCNAGLEQVASLCHSFGHDLSAIATALGQWTEMPDAIGRALNSIGGYTATEIVNALQQAGWAIGSAARAVKAFLGENWKEILNALDEAFPDDEVVKCLRNQYGKSIREIAGWHKELSYGIGKSYDYLKVGFETTDKAVAQAFRDVGYACSTVCAQLKRYVDGETAGNILKTIGYGKSEIESSMKSIYNWSSGTFNDWWSKTKDIWDYATGWI